MNFDKIGLLDQLRRLIRDEIEIIERSVASAAEAATHPESKPENKYDTRGLEASYLAGAQKERAAELKGVLLLLAQLTLRTFSDEDVIAPLALVELEHVDGLSYSWLLPFGTGYSLEQQGLSVLTISPQSPLGQALLGKYVGDSFVLKNSQNKREYSISSVL